MIQEEFSLKHYAHIGDAIWEVFVRNYVIRKTSNNKLLHKLTTDRVNAAFQKNMLNMLTPMLTEDEEELARRGRNLSIPIGRRHIQAEYRQATAFEVLIGYWYLHEPQRLDEIYKIIGATEMFI